MGTPDFAVPALKAIHNSQHQICAVVTNPDKPYGRGQKLKSSDIKNHTFGADNILIMNCM